MSLVNYPKEPGGGRCGATWDRELTVSGYLPTLNFGSDIRETLPPLSTAFPDSPGRDTAFERGLRESVAQAIGTYSERVSLSGVLTPSEKASTLWLLDFASAALTAVGAIYQKWVDRDGGSWPLDEGDLLKDFDSRCTTFGERVMDGPFGEPVICPQQGEATQRTAARQRIAQLLTAALEHTRCAQYVYLRIVLHRRALDAYREQEGFVVGGLGSEEPPDHPGPGVGFGGLTGDGGGDVDPADLPKLDEDPVPPGIVDPFPNPLPPPADPELPDPDKEGETHGPEGAVSSDVQLASNKVALVVGGVLLGALLWKAMR